MAGNSFASTVAQANLIASLVNAYGWTTIRKGNTAAEHQNAGNNPSDGFYPAEFGLKRSYQQPVGGEQAQERQPKRLKPDSSTSHKRKADTSDPIEANGQPCQPLMKRMRGKQPDPFLQGVEDRITRLIAGKPKASKRGRGRPAGSKNQEKTKTDRQGKSNCLSVWQKMEMIQEYERLKSLGTITHVESFMLKNGKMKGGYQGCFSKTKWLGSREKYKWDAFIKHCPNLSKKVREVPNSLLEVLGVSVSSLQFKHYLCYSSTFYFDRGLGCMGIS